MGGGGHGQRTREGGGFGNLDSLLVGGGDKTSVISICQLFRPKLLKKAKESI